MLLNYTFTVADRFIEYVKINTQSNAASNTFPSTKNQLQLTHILAQQLQAMGISNAYADEYGYVYATLKSNSPKKVAAICFCSHVDTTSDCIGNNVKPIIHKAYLGQDIILPDDETQIISPKKYPYLLKHIGEDIITASGLTLLGADDKAGVAIIMDLCNFLQQNTDIKHGDISIVFTPDEEIGMGTANINMQQINAAVGYTLDGGERGTLEDETFSANLLTLTIKGISAHPGAAKGIMVNAVKVAAAIIDALPKNCWSPETTEKREGFIHPLTINGVAENVTIEFLIRDFDTSSLALHEQQLKTLIDEVIQQFIGATYLIEVKEQYRNMKEVLDHHPLIVKNAEQAYAKAGLQVVKEPIRGGTDGSKLSFMGLPCVNLFTGMQAIHSKHEWVAISDMEKAVETLVYLVQIWEEQGI
jgi:tripeptide aminopeptidase